MVGFWAANSSHEKRKLQLCSCIKEDQISPSAELFWHDYYLIWILKKDPIDLWMDGDVWL